MPADLINKPTIGYRTWTVIIVNHNSLLHSWIKNQPAAPHQKRSRDVQLTEYSEPYTEHRTIALQPLITCEATTQKRASACVADTETGNRSVDSETDETKEDSHDGNCEDDDEDSCNDAEAALNMPNAAASAAAVAALSSFLKLKSECMKARRRTCTRVTAFGDTAC